MTELFATPFRYWTAGGPLLIPLACVCFAIWAYFMRTRRTLETAVTESGDAEGILTGGKGTESPSVLRRRLAAAPGLLAGCLLGALRDADGGAQLGPALDERQRRELDRMRWDMLVLSALTVVAPLLGLLGTVSGMIKTFEAVSASAGGTAARVASGVSQALITTQVGLTVAIPGVFGLARLERLHDQVKVRFARCKAYLLLAVAGHSGEENSTS